MFLTRFLPLTRPARILVLLVAAIVPAFAQERILTDLPYASQPHPRDPDHRIGLTLDLYLPPVPPPEGDSLLERAPWPVLVLCHAGSYAAGDKSEFRRLGADLARRGIASLAINYRLGTVPDAGTETEAVSMVYDDVRAAFEWIAQHAADFGLDADRVYVAGGSSGGHLSIATGVLYPGEKRRPIRLRGAIGMYGGYFTEGVSAGATPLLISQGTADRACLPEASRRMAGLYRQAGAWCRMLLVEGMVHDWGGERYLDKIIMRIQEFMRLTTSPGFSGLADPDEPAEILLPAESVETTPLPGGRFTMGNDFGEMNERPAHSVDLAPYRLARTETTVAQFRAFVRETGYRTGAEQPGRAWVLDLRRNGSLIRYFESKPDANWLNPYYPQDDSFPVTMVAWRDCIEYCNWLSRRDGLEPYYRLDRDKVVPITGATGWRLPSEAEWECAARLGWKGTPVRLEQLYADKTAYYPRAFAGSAIAGEADAAGFYWLLGNVSEWVWDCYDSYPAIGPYPASGPAETGLRVSRGGGWYQNWYTVQLEPTKRWWESPDNAVYNYMGFRVARDATP